jgi:type IV pilus assembly protein PilB
MEKAATNQKFLELLLASSRHLVSGAVQPYLIRHGGPTLAFLEALIRAELVAKDAACRIWGDSLGIAYVNPLVSVVTADALAKLPREIVVKAQVIGLFIIEGTLTVAMATPEDKVLVERLSAIAGCPLSPVFALPEEIRDAINLHYAEEIGVQEQLLDWEKVHTELAGKLSDDDLQMLINDSTIPRILDALIFEAMRQRASDIHLEPREAEAHIRFRIDGRLHEMYTCGRAVLRAFLIRCKVLTKLNVLETRLPQDGRFSLPFGMSTADFRYSEIPTQHGNKGVIRILSGIRSQHGFRITDLGMLPHVHQPFERLIHSPNGIFLVTGPTGSGKTTTLYAALDALNSAEVNICTIEDPIEIRLAGTNQSQIHPAIGLTFQGLLRSLLRQDPDILLVGEIRDGETARIATQGALTGHMVLSSLHTNNAVQAIVRLIDLGVEPYLVAPSIVGVLAQRLVRRICEHCRQVYQPDRATLDRFFMNVPESTAINFFKGQGCPACRRSGYHGRLPVHELVVVDDHLRALIARNASQTQLIAHTRRTGCRSLRHDALKKVLLGLTTIEEVESQTVVEWETTE